MALNANCNIFQTPFGRLTPLLCACLFTSKTYLSHYLDIVPYTTTCIEVVVTHIT